MALPVFPKTYRENAGPEAVPDTDNEDEDELEELNENDEMEINGANAWAPIAPANTLKRPFRLSPDQDIQSIIVKRVRTEKNASKPFSTPAPSSDGQAPFSTPVPSSATQAPYSTPDHAEAATSTPNSSQTTVLGTSQTEPHGNLSKGPSIFGGSAGQPGNICSSSTPSNVESSSPAITAFTSTKGVARLPRLSSNGESCSSFGNVFRPSQRTMSYGESSTSSGPSRVVSIGESSRAAAARQPQPASRKVSIPDSLGVRFKGKGRFSFWDSLFAQHSILMDVARHLDYHGLLNIYCISKDVYTCFAVNMATLITYHAWLRAPESADVFHFKLYADLCVVDPGRRPHPRIPGQIRLVPGFRWLKMVYFREDTVRSIVRHLGREGHRLPKGSPRALKHLWLLMDFPDNARRVGLIHNEKFFPEEHLARLCTFFMKLDLRLGDPLNPYAQISGRAMLLAQRSLSRVHDVLRGKGHRRHAELLTMLAEWRVLPSTQHHDRTVFGVQPHHVGRLAFEGWRQGATPLLRPDELVINELLRRGVPTQNYTVDMMLYGNIDLWTGHDIMKVKGEKVRVKNYDSEEEFLCKVEKKVKKMKLQEEREKKDGRCEDKDAPL